jgi:hypothetical protein
MYPKDDEQFEDAHVAKVEKNGEGWLIEKSDGWSIFVPGDSQIVPEAGMPVRLYGKGIGFAVRGMFLAGVKVYYRTEEEDAEKREIDLYGADAADWLARWDEGRSVWSIEMGGLGPGYEQCIHITAAEILRHLLERKYDAAKWEDKAQWQADRDEIEKYGFANKTVSALGLSGAQWGAAMNLAAMFYRHGPRAVMTDERVKDRHIQVQRTFPQAEAA